MPAGTRERDEVVHRRRRLAQLRLRAARRAPSTRRLRGGRARAAARRAWRRRSSRRASRCRSPRATGTEPRAAAAGRTGSPRRRTAARARARATPTGTAPAARAPARRRGRRRSPRSDLVERADERHAVVLSAAQLLRPADEERRDHLVRQHGERVPHDGRVVLAVDQDDRSAQPLHLDDVTSSSIRAVYFSKVFVSLENWMIRSCSWNGYLRHTSTCVPSTSTTL